MKISKYSNFSEPLMRYLIIPVMLALSGAVAAAKDESLWGKLQIHGFASQGYIESSDNRFFGDSDSGSTDFTEVGINASIKATPSLLLSGQLITRNAGDIYDHGLQVDYALADYNFYSSERNAVGVRVGRIKNTLGLHNETRDVAFTRPSIFLPEVIYFDTVRNAFLSSDGVNVYGDSFQDFGTLSWVLGAGQTLVDDRVERGFLGADFDGDLGPEGISLLGSLTYTTVDDSLTLRLSGLRAEIEFDADPVSALTSGNIKINYWVASTQYNLEYWTLTAEYMQLRTKPRDLGILIPDDDTTAEGFYLQAAWRIRPDFEWILNYQEGYNDISDRNGDDASLASGGFFPAFTFFSKIWTTGLRWDVTPSFMVRAEYQLHEGTFILARFENPDPSLLNENWHLFALLASYRF